MFARFEQEDYEKYKGQVLYGRIRAYDTNDGYGYIYTELGKDIFVSSHALPNSHAEKKLRLGTTVKFIPGTYNEKFVAQDVEIVQQEDLDESIQMPNGRSVKIKNITRFGYAPGDVNVRQANVSPDELKAHGYNVEDFDCVYFQTKWGDRYVFYRPDCPIDGDGKIKDPKAYIKQLESKFLYL